MALIASLPSTYGNESRVQERYTLRNGDSLRIVFLVTGVILR